MILDQLPEQHSSPPICIVGFVIFHHGEIYAKRHGMLKRSG